MIFNRPTVYLLHQSRQQTKQRDEKLLSQKRLLIINDYYDYRGNSSLAIIFGCRDLKKHKKPLLTACYTCFLTTMNVQIDVMWVTASNVVESIKGSEDSTLVGC
jgi:hypothetical protein